MSSGSSNDKTYREIEAEKLAAAKAKTFEYLSKIGFGWEMPPDDAAFREYLAKLYEPMLARAAFMVSCDPSLGPVEAVAEHLAVQNFIRPPHWTGWVICVSCGTVPGYPESKGERVNICPWCDTPLRKTIDYIMNPPRYVESTEREHDDKA